MLFVSESAFRNIPFSLLIHTLFLLRSLFIFSLLGRMGWEGWGPVALLGLCWGSPDFCAPSTAPPPGPRESLEFSICILKTARILSLLAQASLYIFSLFLHLAIADIDFFWDFLVHCVGFRLHWWPFVVFPGSRNELLVVVNLLFYLPWLWVSLVCLNFRDRSGQGIHFLRRLLSLTMLLLTPSFIWFSICPMHCLTMSGSTFLIDRSILPSSFSSRFSSMVFSPDAFCLLLGGYLLHMGCFAWVRQDSHAKKTSPLLTMALLPTISPFLNLEHKQLNQFSQKLHLLSPTFFIDVNLILHDPHAFGSLSIAPPVAWEALPFLSLCLLSELGASVPSVFAWLRAGDRCRYWYGVLHLQSPLW